MKKYPYQFMCMTYNDARDALAIAIDALLKDSAFLLEFTRLPSRRAAVEVAILRQYRLDSWDVVCSHVLLLADVREYSEDKYNSLLWRPSQKRLLDVLLDRIGNKSPRIKR